MLAAQISVSIVVLAYNGCEALTRPCIESLLKNTEPGTYELILVDNASSDSTPQFLTQLASEYSNIKLCLNTENKGYAGGNNDGIRLAKGQYVVLLNNDTLVGPGWLAPMLNLLSTHRNVGLVGPLTNSAGNEQRVNLPNLNEKNFVEVAGQYAVLQRGRWFETDKLGFFCVVGRRELFEKNGLLDEQFGIGMFEDDDYCVRVRQAGYKLAIVEDGFVYHKGSMSFKKLPSEDYLKFFDANRTYFLNKHQLAWTYSDIAIAIWHCIRNSLYNGNEASLQSVKARLQVMEDALHQVRQHEENTVVVEGVSAAERKLAEKHVQLMDISDWATSLKQANDQLKAELDDKHVQLMEISNWATSLRYDNSNLSNDLAQIRTSFLYRVIRRLKLAPA